MKTIALIGEPATGKTTIAREVLRRLGPGVGFKSGLLRGTVHGNVHVFGIYGAGTFDGTDKLSMAVQPHAVEFINRIKSEANAVVFFEGDRLGNIKFLSECDRAGELSCFFLSATINNLVKRHNSRGDTQTPTFLSGRRTKVANIMDSFEGKAMTNDSEEEMRAVVDSIVSEIGSHNMAA